MGGLVVVLLPFQRCFQSEGRAGQGRRKQREQRGSKEAVLGASEYWLAQGRGRGGTTHFPSLRLRVWPRRGCAMVDPVGDRSAVGLGMRGGGGEQGRGPGAAGGGGAPFVNAKGAALARASCAHGPAGLGEPHERQDGERSGGARGDAPGGDEPERLRRLGPAPSKGEVGANEGGGGGGGDGVKARGQ